VLADPAEIVAIELAASLAQHADVAPQASRAQPQRGPRRHRALRILAVAVCLFFMATAIYWIPQHLLVFDLVNLLLAIAFGLIAGVLAIAFWKFGDAFFEAYLSDE
jgi:hypothetical protein